jgi:two-component system nitrate/nitrite response regulator NarL
MVTRLVLVDDDEMIRDGMKALLESQPDFFVLGHVSSSPPAFELLDQHCPDLALVAQSLDGMEGPAVVRELLRRQPALRVLLFGSRGDADAVRAALSAGVRGYVLRRQPAAQLFEAIRAVAHGDTYLAPGVAHLVVADHLRLHRGEPARSGPCDHLSRRERDVFNLLVRGHNNQHISRLLGISVKTVETHRTHVLRKTEVHSVVDLVRYAARHQLPID